MDETLEINPAIFIDRDGTLIEEVDFLSRPEDMRVFGFSAQALQIFKDQGYKIIVITNQSGVGRGYFNADDVQSVHNALAAELPDLIDAFYFCPHHPEDGCSCRKPSSGMIEQAVKDHGIDVANSWIIGDKKLDVETGFNTRMSTAMVLTGYGELHVKDLDRMPDIVADNILEAAKLIASRDDRTR